MYFVLNRRFATPLAYPLALATVAVATGVAIVALLAAQEFVLPSGPQLTFKETVPSCYRVQWGVVDSLYRPNRILYDASHLPSYITLESDYAVDTRQKGESWRALTFSDSLEDSGALRDAVQFAGWRPVAADSVDVLLEIFPMGLRLRFASASSAPNARTRINWDTPGTQLANVHLNRIDCHVDKGAHPTA